MTDLTAAELVASVASAAVKATLAAGTGSRQTASRPVVTPLAPPKPKPPAAPSLETLAVCVHEAAHAVAGVALGGELRDAVVFDLREGDLKGLTRFRDCPDRLKTMVAYAGPWAEAKFQAGGQRPTQRQLFAALDGHGCRDQRVLVAAGGLHEGADVQPIIERCWSSVLTLARQLHRVGQVHHEDALAALGVDTTRPVGSQLSSIRSGGQIVPPFTTRTPAPA